MDADPETSGQPERWHAGDNEYTHLDEERPDAHTVSAESVGVIRSARNLESYKRVFGPDFGKAEETILDVGAGDATIADEIEALTDHRATVIRLDRDYDPDKGTRPDGNAPAIAGDATAIPLANDSIDQIVCHNMMYYLGREQGAQAISEMIRVLSPGGEAAIYQAKPFTPVHSEIGRKEKHGALLFPNLVITKPEDFDRWDETRKQGTYQELARAVTFGENVTKLIGWGVARAIERKDTHRTIERGSSSSL